MSKTIAAQNLKLIQSIHNQIDFLKQFSIQQLTQISNKSFFFVFSSGTMIAQQKQQIDFIGIILQGKVTISGKSQKKSSGYVFGQLGYFGIIDKHTYSIVGQSDGIVMAIRFQDIPKLNKEIRSTINMYALSQALYNLKNPNALQMSQTQQVQQRKIAHILHHSLKSLLNEQIDAKQKQKLLKYFPYQRFMNKNQVISKVQQPYLLYIVQGQLVIKYDYEAQGQPIHKLTAGQFYNVQGFLLNYSKNVNIYCFSDDAIVLKINRRLFQNLMDSTTVQKFDNFLLRKQINDQKYEVLTYQKRKEKQAQLSREGNKGKWSMFMKTNYEILPLSLPKNAKKEAQKTKSSVVAQKQQKQGFQGVIFRQYQHQSKNIKTASSVNSKMNKIITMKTQKNQQKTTSTQQQLKQVQKQLDMLNTKIKYYEENFIKAKLEMIQYKSKYNMNSVFKEINQLGDKRHRNKIGGDTSAKVMTLKKAFQQQMKQNKIMEVVARCAYRWLWAVRRKKGFSKMGITK